MRASVSSVLSPLCVVAGGITYGFYDPNRIVTVVPELTSLYSADCARFGAVERPEFPLLFDEVPYLNLLIVRPSVNSRYWARIGVQWFPSSDEKNIKKRFSHPPSSCVPPFIRL